MKKIIILTFLILASCASKVKFPVSNVTPGAEITVKTSKDDNGNSKLKLKAKFLTSPERLSPSKKFYLVWLQTKSNGLQNLGKFETDASSKASFETITPYEPDEIFITAEDDAAIKYPTGQEISRAKL
ncbi:MAG TPA: hypothetical protein PK218_00655 [Flavobacterium sp.]|jgi:hypothetical protein|uniref:hypothetical protein n=1 Tax=Flavobacterium sp. TaxID=239 RepID=UPI002B5DA1AB|nr:hypothetical protein [Flavobacterium sp.]MCA0348588.1 hypothetical protein [Bacteroidota bacterium]HPW97051.1 hypothetical protein [Flavobacterium sp.]HQA73249.1 hypothetical protein [Flavobacterium sp.]